MIPQPTLKERCQEQIDRMYQIWEWLATYRKTIDEAEYRRWELDCQIKQKEDDIQQAEYGFAFEVESDTLDNGKPKHSNKEKREMEVARRMSLDPGVTENRELLKKLKQDKFVADRECFNLRDEFRSFQKEHDGRKSVLDHYTEIMVLEASNGNQGRR